MSKYVAKSITMIAGRFSHKGLCQLQSFHQHLNQQHPKIQFTVEEEKDDQLPFLDVRVSKEEGRLLTSVYRNRVPTPKGTSLTTHITPRGPQWESEMHDMVETQMHMCSHMQLILLGGATQVPCVVLGQIDCNKLVSFPPLYQYILQHCMYSAISV